VYVDLFSQPPFVLKSISVFRGGWKLGGRSGYSRLLRQSRVSPHASNLEVDDDIVTALLTLALLELLEWVSNMCIYRLGRSYGPHQASLSRNPRKCVFCLPRQECTLR